MTDQTPSPQSVVVPVEPTEVMRLVPDRVLTEALYWMARGYERVHSMPRVSDTELANKIEAAKADLGRARDASPILAALSPEAPARDEWIAATDRPDTKGDLWLAVDAAGKLFPGVFVNHRIPVEAALVQRIMLPGQAALTPRHEAPASEGDAL